MFSVIVHNTELPKLIKWFDECNMEVIYSPYGNDPSYYHSELFGFTKITMSIKTILFYYN